METKNKKSLYEIFLPFSLASIAALGPFSVDSYLPAIPQIALEFGENVSNIQLTVSIYLFGLSLGQIIGGPLSDNVGRKRVLIYGLLIYMIPTIIMIFADSFVTLVPLRLLQSFGGGFCSVIPASTVRDSFKGKEVARNIATIGFIMLSAPMFAPLIGTSILNSFGWHSIFAFMAIYSLILLVYSLLFFKETKVKSGKGISLKDILNKYSMIFKNKKSLFIIATVALSYAALFCFITGGSYFYIEIWHKTPKQFSIFFAINILMLVVLNRMNPIFLRIWESRKLFLMGLILQFIGAVALVYFLSIDSHLYYLTASIALVSGSIGLTSPNGLTCLLEDHIENSGSAVAMMGATNFIVGGLAGAILSHFQTNSSWSLVLAMSGFSLLAFILMLTKTNPALKG